MKCKSFHRVTVFLLVVVSDGFWRGASLVYRWSPTWLPVSSDQCDVHLLSTWIASSLDNAESAITSATLICVYSGDMCGLLSHFTICSGWNSFRKCAFHWPKEKAAASTGAQDPSLPLCGSFSASISISRTFIYLLQTYVAKAKCFCELCGFFLTVLTKGGTIFSPEPPIHTSLFSMQSHQRGSQS